MKQLIRSLLTAAVVLYCSTGSAAQWLDKLDLKQYPNQVVYLDFWASWCVPCRKSFPWLNEMQAKYQEQGLVIIGINLDRDIKTAKRFVTAYPADFLLYSDPKAVFAREYKIAGMPSSFLISRDGRVIESHIGFKKSEQLLYEANIKKSLRRNSKIEETKP
ncbi:TlpA disulfide reductase family protein [Psychromonas aquimarina]|uniref:TlpA disulfide reductase family protein n=1 Tax=Psychromonas aquimarina TaxID=444919 RepID=UPI00042898BF|nr:TlpA disulfide reductase family protein [Psychromonas aquimarina]